MSSLSEDLEREVIQRIVALSRPLNPEPVSVVPILKPLPGIRTVLFDVYGTLLVSASGDIREARGRDREDSLHDALVSVGFSRATAAAAALGIQRLDQLVGETHEIRRREGIKYPEVDVLQLWTKVLEELLGRGLIAGMINEAAVACLAVEYESRMNPVWPMPHLRETVDALHASDRKLGIVSNAQFYTPLMLGAFPETGWNDGRFDAALCVWSYQLLEAKPSARLVQTALQSLKERHGIEPAEVLCVGNDMLNDILPAAQLGCRTALFAGDRRSYRPRVAELGASGVKADLVVTDLMQIPRSLA